MFASKNIISKACAAIIVVIIVIGVWLLLPSEEKKKAQVLCYTFEDHGNSSAWKGVGAEQRPTPNLTKYMPIALGNESYDRILARDNNSESISSQECEEQKGYPYQLFRFKIAKKNIKTLSIIWEGFGADFQKKSTGAALYIWNKKHHNWTEIGNYSSKTGEQIINRTFVNASSLLTEKDFIFVLAYCEICGVGRSNSVLGTDYVEIRIIF